MVLAVGTWLTIGVAALVWSMSAPPFQVQTRIVADGDSKAGRAALAEAALRVGSAPGQFVALDEFGTSLIIAVEDSDAAAARRRVRSLTEALLSLPLTPAPVPTAPKPADMGTGFAALLAERSRLTGLIEAADTHATSVSAALATLARDIATAARTPPPDQKAGRDMLDRGAAALAALQLQRIQLQSRYQDDYPAVLAVVNQIEATKAFLQDEARRIDPPARPTPAPADAILAAERDRLRSELYKVNERRLETETALAANIREVDRLKAKFADMPAELPPAPPASVLMEAATTVSTGPDIRWLTVPAAICAAFLLSLLAWLRPPPQRRRQPEALVRRVEGISKSLPDSIPALRHSRALRALAGPSPQPANAMWAARRPSSHHRRRSPRAV